MTLLFKALRLFGLDVPARLASARAAIDQRLETVKAEGRQVARTAAVIAASAAIAAVATIGLVAVALVALYLWVSEHYGPYIGLGVVAAALLVVVAASASSIVLRTSSTGSRREPRPRPGGFTASVPASSAGASRQKDLAAAPDSPAEASAGTRAAMGSTLDLSGLASDALKPLGLLLGRYLTTPTRHPILNEALRHLRTQAEAASEDPIAMASRTVRDGDRKSMIAVLAGAAFLGWVLTKYPGE